MVPSRPQGAGTRPGSAEGVAAVADPVPHGRAPGVVVVDVRADVVPRDPGVPCGAPAACEAVEVDVVPHQGHRARVYSARGAVRALAKGPRGGAAGGPAGAPAPASPVLGPAVVEHRGGLIPARQRLAPAV